MPIYEFYCSKNHRIYSFFARSLAYSSLTPLCPDNPAYPMERMISGFSVTGRAKEPESAPGPADDPRMERMMAEMESELSGMDDADADPKRVAAMMKKMCAMTGEPISAAMQEMLQRMEAGDDPEKLESEYGDLFDEMESSTAGEEGESAPPSQKGRIRRLPPRRDPTLYEMADFLDASSART